MLRVAVRDVPGRRDFLLVARAAELLAETLGPARSRAEVFNGTGPPPRWHLYWGLAGDADLGALGPDQTVNSVPGFSAVGDKPGLHRLVR